jgi:hypothetical protein
MFGSYYNRKTPDFGLLSGTPYPSPPPSDVFEIKQRTASKPLQIRYTDDYIVFSCGDKATYLPFNGRTLSELPRGYPPFGSAMKLRGYTNDISFGNQYKSVGDTSIYDTSNDTNPFINDHQW